MSGNSFDPFENPGEARAWLGRFLERVSNGEKIPAARANAVFKGIDSWVKLFRLQKETADIEKLEADLIELRELISAGPKLVKDGK